MLEAKPGDQIKACGELVTIRKILYQEYWESRDLWDIEFLDSNGNYRHWIQAYDGGHFLPKFTVEDYSSTVYVATLYRYGRTINCADVSEEKAIEKVMAKYVKMYEDSNDMFDPEDLDEDDPDRIEFESLRKEAEECIEIEKYEIGKAFFR